MPGKGLPIEPGLIGMPGKLVMTMQPVSVCQNVSWNGRPKASRDQSTASGLSGSPTLARCRSEERSCLSAAGVPSRISRRIAVGAEYQTVTCRFSMKPYQRSALKPESRTTCVMPFDQGPMIPYDVPVTQPGSALHQ